MPANANQPLVRDFDFDQWPAGQQRRIKAVETAASYPLLHAHIANAADRDTCAEETLPTRLQTLTLLLHARLAHQAASNLLALAHQRVLGAAGTSMNHHDMKDMHQRTHMVHFSAHRAQHPAALAFGMQCVVWARVHDTSRRRETEFVKYTFHAVPGSLALGLLLWVDGAALLLLSGTFGEQ